MKKLIGLLAVLLLIAGSQAQALTARAWSEGVGYSQAEFIFDTADADSAVKKIVLFRGLSLTTMIRLDSLTSSITDPDSIAKAVGTFEEGETYYWYVQLIDSTTTIYVPFDYKTAPYSFTTTDLQQNTTVSSISYSTVNIIVDSTGLGIGVGIDSVRLDIDKTDGTTYDASITTVTYPDTFKVTGNDEGGIYWYRTIAFLTDSAAADTLTAASFTMLDMAISFTLWKVSNDSAFFFVDSTTISVDSVIMQWGAGARVLGFGIAGHTADTTTTVTYPDTIIIVGLITDAIYVARLLSFDAVAIDTSATLTITMISYPEAHDWQRNWSKDVYVYDWEFTKSSQSYSAFIPITGYNWMRSSLKLWGEDDVATYDSIRVLRYAKTLSGDVLLDTLLAGDVDTASLSGDIFRLGLAGPDSLLDAYPIFTLEGFIEVIADMTDSSATTFNDSTLGIRKVYLTLEFWK